MTKKVFAIIPLTLTNTVDSQMLTALGDLPAVGLLVSWDKWCQESDF